MKFKLLIDGNGKLNANSYLIYNEDSKIAYIIDASIKSELFINKIEELGLTVKYVLLTHGHWDHIYAIDFWRDEYNATIVSHKNGKHYHENPEFNLSEYMYVGFTKKVDKYLYENYGKIDIFEYYSTPGHTTDSVVYKLNNLVFTGDLIFFETVGRTDFPGSIHKDLVNSIKNIIYKFDDDTILLPGHGRRTTVKYEKENNNFIRG